MPGTLYSDANAFDLADGLTLNATGSDTGDIFEAPYSGYVGVKLVTGTVTGTSPTLDVVIQGSDSPSFGSGVVDLGAFPQIGNEDDVTKQIVVYHDKRYIRAAATLGGTNPDFTGTEITLTHPHDHRTAATTA